MERVRVLKGNWGSREDARSKVSLINLAVVQLVGFVGFVKIRKIGRWGGVGAWTMDAIGWNLAVDLPYGFTT